MSKIKLYVLSLLSMLLVLGSAQAAIVSSSGDVSIISAPASVDGGALQSNTSIIGFDEIQNYTLVDDLYVNALGAAGTYVRTGNAATDFISAGTTVNSYLFHADSVSTELTRFLGAASFDADILGIIFELNELGTTDTILGSSGTIYPTVPNYARSMDFLNNCQYSASDCATISSDLRTITLDLGTTVGIDQIRVITATATAAVPEPSSLLLLLAGLGFLGFKKKRSF